MTGRKRLLSLVLAMAVLAGGVQADCPAADTHFRLYRSSAAIQGAAIHVATFDADERAAQGGGAAEYNRDNCESVAYSKASRA